MAAGEVARDNADAGAPRDGAVTHEGADAGKDIVQGGAAMDVDRPR